MWKPYWSIILFWKQKCKIKITKGLKWTLNKSTWMKDENCKKIRDQNIFTQLKMKIK